MILHILMGSFEAISVWFLTYDPFALGGPTRAKRTTTWGEEVELTLILNLSDNKIANVPFIFLLKFSVLGGNKHFQISYITFINNQ